jgi:hypothetical protein
VLNYQILYDEFLDPILDHPGLNPDVRFVIEQFAHNLSVPYRGMKMAITREERALARALYEAHSEAIDAILEVLEDEAILDASGASAEAVLTDSQMIGTGGPSDTGPDVVSGRASGPIRIRMDSREFAANSAPGILEQALRYWVDNAKLAGTPLPWGVSASRYFVTNKLPPVHPNGRPFFAPRVYNDYAIETHKSRAQALRTLQDFCIEQLGLSFEILEQ